MKIMRRLEEQSSVMAKASSRTWSIFQRTVKTAFSNGELNEAVYVSQPEECNPDTHRMCTTQESSLRLNKAPRACMNKLSIVSNPVGFTKGVVDPNTLHEKNSKHPSNWIAGFSKSQRHLYQPIQICSGNLEKVWFDSCTPIDTPMAERPNLDEDKG
ncbi:retrovirus-related pol polyprotein from transposon TNT 1-94 [Tanacetum coccineum]